MGLIDSGPTDTPGANVGLFPGCIGCVDYAMLFFKSVIIVSYLIFKIFITFITNQCSNRFIFGKKSILSFCDLKYGSDYKVYFYFQQRCPEFYLYSIKTYMGASKPFDSPRISSQHFNELASLPCSATAMSGLHINPGN